MTASTPHEPLEASNLTPSSPTLQVVDGWKSFGHVVALRGVSLAAYQGEVLALVGDNGAGKSTLVKVLAGVHTLDSGELRVRGDLVDRADPQAARRRGISTVFQDLAIVETLDIAANMFLGQPTRRARLFANRREMIDEAAATLRNLRVRVPNVRVPAGELSGGQRQGVAIARAVRQNNPIILMDEPTAALGVRETGQVGEMIHQLRDRGKTVILVSHDLEFVFKVADRIQILRLGRIQAVRRLTKTTRSEVVGFITGTHAPDPHGGADGEEEENLQ